MSNQRCCNNYTEYEIGLMTSGMPLREVYNVIGDRHSYASIASTITLIRNTDFLEKRNSIKRNRYTEYEMNLLKSDMSDSDIHDIIGDRHTRGSISATRYYLFHNNDAADTSRSGSGARYTQYEDKMISENHMSDDELSIILKRTVGSIRVRRSHLKNGVIYKHNGTRVRNNYTEYEIGLINDSSLSVSEIYNIIGDRHTKQSISDKRSCMHVHYTG